MDGAALIRNNSEIVWKGAARTVLKRARLYLAILRHSEKKAAGSIYVTSEPALHMNT